MGTDASARFMDLWLTIELWPALHGFRRCLVFEFEDNSVELVINWSGRVFV